MSDPFQLPGYDQIELVGEGGLGRVYRAVRISTGGLVAIKELRSIDETSKAWQRANREVEAMLRLKGHPYVVSVEEVTAGPAGPCLVMEYASGGSVLNRLEHRRFTAAELVLIGEQVLDALGAAHANGIIHRDIKPHNLLIGNFGQVKVCDFGIAALARDGIIHTQTNALSLGYASPEELDGDEVGPKADVYSFAATMMHLVTGERPTMRSRLAGIPKVVDADPRLSEIIDQLRAALADDPEDRPTIDVLADVFHASAGRLGTERVRTLAPGDASVGSPAGSSAPRSSLPAAERAAVPTDGAPPTILRAPQPAPAAGTLPPPLPDLVAPSPSLEHTSVGARGRALKIGLSLSAVGALLTVGIVVVLAKLGGDDRPDTDAAPTSTAVTVAPTVASTEPSTTTATTELAGPTTTEGQLPEIQLLDDSDGLGRFLFALPTAGSMWTADGKLAMVYSAGEIVLLDPASGEQTSSVLLNRSFDGAAVLSPDGSRLVALDGDRGLIFDASTGELTAEFSEALESTASPVMSPDGTLLITSNESGSGGAKLWDVASGTMLRVLHAPLSVWVTGTGFIAGTNDFYTLAGPPAQDYVFTVWDGVTHEQRASFPVPNAFAATVGADGSTVATLGIDELSIWTIGGELLGRTPIGRGVFLGEPVISSDGTMVAAPSDTGVISVWTTAGELVSSFEVVPGVVRRIEFAHGVDVLAVISDDQEAVSQLAVFDVGRRVELARVSAGRGIDFFGEELAFSPDDAWLVAAARVVDQNAVWWNTAESFGM